MCITGYAINYSIEPVIQLFDKIDPPPLNPKILPFVATDVRSDGCKVGHWIFHWPLKRFTT
jgi:hypothetical protein